jgi:large subunit ribosomal protein L9
MKVLLKKDFELIGTAGEIKEVKDGYARNYLIPQGIATLASSSNVKSFEEVRRQQGRKILRETNDAKIIASRLETDLVTIKVKTAEEGKIYGSVTPLMIHEILLQKGYSIDRKKINIPEHIKSLGEFIVDVKLYNDVVAKLRVNVEDEEAVAEESMNEEQTETTEEEKSG